MFNPSGPDDILEVEVQIPFEPLRKERGSPLWSVQKPFFESEARYPAFYGGRGVGKALALDTPLPTVGGWTTMAQVRVGDELFDESGCPTHVTFVSDVQDGRPCYLLSFSDGESLVADGEHLWSTWVHRDRKNRARGGRGTSRIHTTEQIGATLLQGPRGDINHSIDVARPLLLPTRELSVDPYVLGVWLGDGTQGLGQITNADQEVWAEIASRGYRLGVERAAGGMAATRTVGALASQRSPWTGRFEGNGSLHSRLRGLGLFTHKHIPRRYLRASFAQRLDLLQGLIDSDGYVAPGGLVEFTSTNRILAEDVRELALTLGFKATLGEGIAKLYGRVIGPKYRVTFTPYLPVARLPRKAARLHGAGNQAQRTRRRYIVAVQPIASVPVRCLTVDSSSHLYLAGRGFIPTHNTTVGAAKFVAAVLEQPMEALVVLPTDKQIAQKSVLALQEMIPSECVIPQEKGIVHATKGLIEVHFGLLGRPEGELSRIWLRTAENPNAIRNLEVGIVWMDELQDIDEYTFTDCVKYACRAPGTPQQVFSTFTPPRDESHWVYKLWLNPDRPHKERYPTWTMETKDNYKLDETLVQEWYEDALDPLTGEMSASGRRELMGQVAGGRRQVFPMFGEIHVRPIPYPEPQWKRVTGGIDYGMGRRATTVIVVAEDQAGRLWWIHEFWSQQLDLQQILQTCLWHQSRYRGITFYADHTDPGTTGSLRRNGINVVMAEKNVDQGIRLMWDRLKVRGDGLPGMFVATHLPHTISEFKGLRFKERVTREGVVTWDAFADDPNDCLDAGRYAIMGLQKRSAQTPPFRIQWGTLPVSKGAFVG